MKYYNNTLTSRRWFRQMGQQNALLHKSKALDTPIEILANPEKQYAFSTTFTENTTH